MLVDGRLTVVARRYIVSNSKGEYGSQSVRFSGGGGRRSRATPTRRDKKREVRVSKQVQKVTSHHGGGEKMNERE